MDYTKMLKEYLHQVLINADIIIIHYVKIVKVDALLILTLAQQDVQQVNVQEMDLIPIQHIKEILQIGQSVNVDFVTFLIIQTVQIALLHHAQLVIITQQIYQLVKALRK